MIHIKFDPTFFKLIRQFFIFELFATRVPSKKKNELQKNAYSIMADVLERDDFDLLLENERSKLKSDIKTFMNDNTESLNLPLTVKLLKGWEAQDIPSAVNKAKTAHQLANETLSKLKVYLLQSIDHS